MSMSTIEKALLEAEQLEETMKSNAKEILSSTMKEEINELVKESLNEENDYLKEQEDTEQEVDMDIDMDSEDEDMGMEMELDIDGGIELPPLDLTSASDEEVLKVFKAMGSEDGIIVQKDDNDDISFIDGEDEFLIKLEENKKSMKKRTLKEMKHDHMEGEHEMGEMDEPMYEIELDEMEDMEEMYDMDEMEDMEEMYDMDEMNEPMYEIELDEDSGEHSHITTHSHDDGDVMGVDAPESEDALEDLEDEDPMYEIELDSEGEMDEMVRQNNLGQKVHTGNRTNKYNKDSRKYSGIHLEHKNRSKGRLLQENYHLLKEEVGTLKNKNSEYRKALVTFKEKLNEVGVFNSNLAYATRLFTEHSTTKSEKINILRRFDNVNSLKESKSLYKILREEFSQNKSTKSKKTISEAVDRKINSTPKSGMDKRLMKETKAYENPQFSRIKDLMSKL